MAELISDAARQLGRYFSLLTVVPASMLVVWTFGLLTSGAWDGPPDLSAALDAFGSLRLPGVLGLVLAALVIGLLLHPLQFAATQLLEGYWGTRPWAVRLIAHRIRHHRLA